MILKDIEAKIAELKEYEYQAWQAKDYQAALMLHGAIIQFERFLGEVEEKEKHGNT